MKDLIHKLFEHFTFKEQKIESGSLYTHITQPYWCIVEEDVPIKILEHQDKLFNECYETIKNADFKKNASLLIITKSENPSQLKDQILRIEENPYHFKKHVLLYSESNFSSLKDNTSEGDPREFLQKLSDQEVFNAYKQEFQPGDWRRLLYNIAFKLSFIEVSVTEEEELQNLFKKSDSDLKNDGLDELKSEIESVFYDLDIDSLQIDDFLEKIAYINGSEN